MRPYIITCEGKFSCLIEAHPDQLTLESIAHSLSHQCRWVGHTPKFYSVAEHSLLVSERMERLGFGPSGCIAGLLHDAHEAVLGDISSPLKHHLNASIPVSRNRVQTMAQGWDEVICKLFDIEHWMLEEAADSDHVVWACEAHHFFPEKAAHFAPSISSEEFASTEPLFLEPEKAKVAFIERYVKLNSERFDG